jgi:hypothetical protein
MIYVLKTILFLLFVAIIFDTKFIYKDFQNVRKSEGFEDLTIWERIRFVFTFFSMFLAATSLLVFLIYFICIKISIL